MDSLEELIRNKGQSGLAANTPPDTEDELRFRRSSIDCEHPKALEPNEPVATEAPANNLPFRLHKAADVPFLFPQFLREGFSLPAVPFPITSTTLHFRTPPVVASTGEMDRYHFLLIFGLTEDYWIFILQRYISGSLSWIQRYTDKSLRIWTLHLPPITACLCW